MGVALARISLSSIDCINLGEKNCKSTTDNTALPVTSKRTKNPSTSEC